MRLIPCLPSSLMITLLGAVVCFSSSLGSNQSTAASLQGRVVDQNGAAVRDAKVTTRNVAVSLERVVESDNRGDFQIVSLPVGTYRVEVQANGFKTKVVERLEVQVGSTVVQDFRLEVGDLTQIVNITSKAPLVERATVSLGQVINEKTLQELPLNGRHFLDLGLLVPGSVTPPQNGFLSAPLRGQGFFGLNTAGNREDTVNIQVNGINLNDQVNNILNFQPPVSSLREFKVDNSTFNAEYGRNSGAVVNVVSRSGTNDWHGELFEFFRNEALDARNFFNFTTLKPPPFKRNQFGGNLGAPIIKNRAYFFFAYEGLRQRQGVDLNSLVLSDAERALPTDPIIRRLVDMIPRANFTDSSGSSRFVGSASSKVTLDQWALDIGYNLSANGYLHAYYAYQGDDRNEPSLQGNTIPGFGDNRDGRRQIFTLTETQVINEKAVNEARFGFNRIFADLRPSTALNPSELGLNLGVNVAIGLPELRIAGGGLNLGGPSAFPSVRGDTTFVVSDTLSFIHARHSLKFGGEFRRFLNNNLAQDPGTFVFPSVASFVTGNANSFAITLGARTSSISQGAVGMFVQDSLRWRPNLTLELGFRYEWNMSPTERYDRFIVFDPETVSLLRVGSDLDQPYKTNNKNLEPRVGIAWDPFRDGKTVVRAAYAIAVEQPLTNAVTSTAANPPLATPLVFAGTVRLDNAINLARAGGLAPVSVDHNYENANVQSWNFNLQRELFPQLAVMIGYVGSKGTHLRISRNINQPVAGVRPFQRLSNSSPYLPNELLGNITQVEGTGNSSYNALWLTVHKRLSRGFQLNASYTWSKSIDYNSFSSPPTAITVQDSYNLRGDRGLSDFDARHRFVLNAIYDFPFKGNRFVAGWQLAAIVQGQSGNPINIVTSNATINGVPNTVRPDLRGSSAILGSVERWFDTSAFVAVPRFGNLGRNVIIGPGFSTVDFSVIKETKLNETVRLEFRTEVFDLLNKANFGQPGRIVASAAFGRIVNTRFPTGDSGSSRQIQFALKLKF